MDQTPRRIRTDGVTIPKPTHELFVKMGEAMRDALWAWCDDFQKRGVNLADIDEDCWSSAAAAVYAQIARAGGGKVEPIEEDRH